MKRMLVTLILICVTGFFCVCKADVDSALSLDSLLTVVNGQTGCDKVRTCMYIAKCYEDESYNSSMDYALKSIAEADSLLRIEDLCDEEHDSVAYCAMYSYLYLSLAYYKSARLSVGDASVDKVQAFRLKEYVDNMERLEQKFRNFEASAEKDYELPVLKWRASSFYYMLDQRFDSAHFYIDKLINYINKVGTAYQKALLLQNKSHAYILQGQNELAEATLNRAIKLLEYESADKCVVLRMKIIQNLSVICLNAGRLDEAEDYLRTCLDMSLKHRNLTGTTFAYQGLVSLGLAREDYKAAFESLMTYSLYSDSLFIRDRTTQLNELEARCRYAESMRKVDHLVNETRISKIRQNVLWIFVIVLGAGIVASIYQSNKNRNVSLQIRKQTRMLNRALVDMQDSIDYASLIQKKIMQTGLEKLDDQRNVLVYCRQQKNIGGDFYYVRQFKGYQVIAAADCTGHGVPGALLTVMCHGLMNDFLMQQSVMPKPHEILEAMRQAIKQTLNSDSNETVALSGMDMALIIVPDNSDVIYFSGANRPLWYVNNGQLTEYRAVRNPLAKYINEKPFQTVEIHVDRGSMVYMFSDGITDQFNEDGTMRFRKEHLRDLLLNVSHLSVYEQRERIDMAFNHFKGNADQTDDVLLVGRRF